MVCETLIKQLREYAESEYDENKKLAFLEAADALEEWLKIRTSQETLTIQEASARLEEYYQLRETVAAQEAYEVFARTGEKSRPISELWKEAGLWEERKNIKEGLVEIDFLQMWRRSWQHMLTALAGDLVKQSETCTQKELIKRAIVTLIGFIVIIFLISKNPRENLSGVIFMLIVIGVADESIYQFN